MAFKDVIGQSRAVNQLRRYAAGGKLPHALIFRGPEGTGRKMCALALARLLNCERPAGEAECGGCPGCLKSEKNVHPDIRVVSAEGSSGEIRIESIRQLRRQIYMKPAEGRYSVFIIDDAGRLNEESSNALLKILEEPPGNSLLVLIAEEASPLRPTIVSRCQTVNFGRLSPEETAEALAKTGEVPAGDIPFLAEASEGSPGKALAIHGMGLEKRGEILRWFADEKNLAPENIIAAGEGRNSGIGPSGKDVREKRERLGWFFETLLSFHRDVLLASAGGGKFLNREFADTIESIAARVKTRGAVEALGIILRAQEAVTLYANPRLVFETAMIELGKLRRDG